MSKASRLKGHCNRLMAIFDSQLTRGHSFGGFFDLWDSKMQLRGFIVLLLGLEFLVSMASQAVRASPVSLPATAWAVPASQVETIRTLEPKSRAALKGGTCFLAPSTELFSAFSDAASCASNFFSTIKTATISLVQTGYAKIGTATPANPLDVHGGVAIGTGYAGTAAPTSGLIVQGYVGIGTASNITAPLTLNGTLHFTGVSSGSGTGASAAGSNTQVQYNNSGSFCADASFTYVTPGALTLGVNASNTGSLTLAYGGSSGQSITIQPVSGTTSTYNFNLPTTAGSSVNILTSGGGSSAAMTWDTTTGSGTVVALATTPTFVTNITDPLVIGGTGASSTLTLESTSSTGTSDSIIFKTGSQATAMTINTSGNVGVSLFGPGFGDVQAGAALA
jgi:hypothetical protein